MTRARRRIGVVGGGIAGLSAAHFLSQDDGLEVTLVEREPRHDAHASGRSAEVARAAIDDPVTRRLAIETGALFADPARAGLPGDLDPLQRTGLFVLANSESPAWAGDLMGVDGAAFVGPEVLAERAPFFRARGDRPGRGPCAWFPAAGRVRARRLTAALARAALARGTRLLRSAGSARIEVRGSRVRALALGSGTELPVDDVVIAAGAWSRDIGRSIDAPVPLRPTRRHIFAFGRADDGARRGTTPIVWDDAAGFYARGADGLWFTSICDTEDAEPDVAPRYAVDPEVERRAIRTFQQHLSRPSAGASEDLRAVRSWTGFRDLTPDDRPILGPDERIEGLHWCAGLGGHGLTISLAAGRALARLVAGHGDPLESRCLRRRFDAKR